MDVAKDDHSDEESPPSLFQEPKDYYAPAKPATFTEYKCQNGDVITLRLVGHSPLWGHLLWNAGQITAKYLEDNAATLVRGRNVLELGAGAGLPSLVAAVLGAKHVVVTDYPEVELINNLSYNIEHCAALQEKSSIVAQGYLWGNSIASLRSSLTDSSDAFDLLILADILFNHSEHEKLVATLQDALKHGPDARALVFFTPYRPWLLSKDLRFFELAEAAGLESRKLFEHTMDKVMFEEDPGDELLRRTVFAYEVKWPDTILPSSLDH